MESGAVLGRGEKMNKIKRTCSDIKKYFKYSLVAAKANLKAEVAGSYLNWIWWILEPFCMMLAYSIVFGRIFHMATEHYSVFIFTGLTLNNFFSSSVKNATSVVKRNKPTISKIYLPKYMLSLTELFINGFKMLMSFLVLFIMMIIEGVPFTWRFLLLIPILIDLFLFTFSVSLFLTHFGVFVEDLRPLTNIALRFLFFFTGIFYDVMDRFPKPYGAYVLRGYPVAKLLDMARSVMIYGKWINCTYLWLLAAICIVVSYLGIQLVYKYENTYMKVI